jgi:prepilin-type N-terminal cleavage/methylation domain-containing protein
MSRKTQKISAFTLTEVMITMAITSIVITLSYYSYQMLNTYFNKFSEDNSFNAECMGLRTAMEKDLEAADYVLSTPNRIEFHTSTSIIKWYSVADTVVRSTQSDVEKRFRLKPHLLTVRKDSKTSYVNRVCFTYWDSSQDSIHFNFYKNYPVSTYINP